MNRQFNEAQRQAIAHMNGPCLTLAGPGSGKTTVIVERICRLLEEGVPARNILVLTFTRAAASEMRQRFLKRMNDSQSARLVLFGTFHSVFFQILRYSGGYDAGSVLQNEQKIQFIEEASRDVKVRHDREGWLQEVLQDISAVKGNALLPEEYQPLSCTSQEFCALYRRYQELLAERRKLDFDDMLTNCLSLFTRRPDILSVWQDRFTYVMIDEYQDSSAIQCQLAEILAQPQNNIMAVGDDDQSIYGFRGAVPERMQDFLKTYPDAARYVLNLNYRCRPEIVRAASQLIGVNKNRLPKELLSARPEAEYAGRMSAPESAYASDDSAKMDSEGGTITCREYNTLTDENEAVRAQILAYHNEGIPYEEMAVLYRTNRDPAQLIRMLSQSGVPLQVKSSDGGLYHHWICQDFCAYLAVAAGSTRRADWLRVISHPERYYSRLSLGEEPVTIDSLFSYYRDDSRRIRSLDRLEYDLAVLNKAPAYAAISHLRRYMGYDEYLKKCDSTGEGTLLETAEELQETADGCQNSAEWLRYVKKESGRSRTDEHGVRFMTMHGAKGLEFRIVFIVDANEGITPSKRADTAEGTEEERRLFYVGMTRAKERLHISWTRERFHRRMYQSRFVEEAGLKIENSADETSTSESAPVSRHNRPNRQNHQNHRVHLLR